MKKRQQKGRRAYRKRDEKNGETGKGRKEKRNRRKKEGFKE